ncbi:MAG: PilZ domain-containing protein [Planctomycetes bacterium]|nr:PilZ domain-containing protein [Planctomycetota bacterium]
MQATAPKNTVFAYELDVRMSQRVLEQAVRRGAALTLTPRQPGSQPWQGTILSGTPESLWVELDTNGGDSGPVRPSVCCDGELDLEATRYIFASNVLAEVIDADGRRLEIVRPQQLQVVQRRRFWRAQLQDSSPVLLERLPGTNGDAWSSMAAMMNVSVDGLACLADRAEADAVDVGERLRLIFHAAGSRESFAFDAVLRNKTPGGSPGQLVLGFQFEPGGDLEQSDRLQHALRSLS